MQCARKRIQKIHHSGELDVAAEAGTWCSFTPICQLISISCIKSDELLLMVRKAVGCLVTFLVKCIACILYNQHQHIHKRTEKSIVPFHASSLALSLFLLLRWANESALIKFYGIFELHKSNSVPVHIITKMLTTTTTTTTTMKKRNENLVLYR